MVFASCHVDADPALPVAGAGIDPEGMTTVVHLSRPDSVVLLLSGCNTMPYPVYAHSFLGNADPALPVEGAEVGPEGVTQAATDQLPVNAVPDNMLLETQPGSSSDAEQHLRHTPPNDPGAGDSSSQPHIAARITLPAAELSI